MSTHRQPGEARCDRPCRQLLALTPQESKAGWKWAVGRGRAGGAGLTSGSGTDWTASRVSHRAWPSGGSGGLTVPVPGVQGAQPQPVRDLRCIRGVGEVLLSVTSVGCEDETLCVLEAVVPQGRGLVLAT